MLKKAFLASLFLALLVSLYGCGQNTSINTTITQPVNLTVMGTVYHWLVTGVNSGNGSWNHYGGPAANAYVTLDGNGQLFTAVTNSNGEYKITGVPDGTYQITITKEGAVYLAPAQTFSIKPGAGTAANGTIVTLPPMTWFDDYTYITAYTPTANSVIPNNQTFTVTFNTPMDTSTVRVLLRSLGIRTLADSGDTVQVDLSWSADDKTVTVTPQGALSSNEVYRLAVLYNYNTAVPNQCYPLDKRGAPLLTTTGQHILAPTIDFRVVAGAVPGAPSGLQVVVNNKSSAEINSSDAITGANTVKLSWTPAPSGVVSAYRVYVARSGSVLEYVPLESSTSTSNISVTPYFTSNMTKVLKALYGTGAQINPITTLNYPFINNTVYFRVVAFNGDGEGSAVETSAIDVVGPRLVSCPARPFAGGWLGTNIQLRPIGVGETTRMYFSINEPVDLTTLIPANFTLTGGLTVSQINHLSSCADPAVFYGTIVEVIASGNLVGQTLTMGTGVKDLTGNPVKVGTGDTLVMN